MFYDFWINRYGGNGRLHFFIILSLWRFKMNLNEILRRMKYNFKKIFDKPWPEDMIARTRSSPNAELAAKSGDD